MNYYFIAAGIFLFISFLIHVVAGNKEYAELKPQNHNIQSDRLHGIWLMGRSCFQMASADLLLTAIFIFLMGINLIPYNFYLSLFIALLYLGYLIFWVLTLFVSKAKCTNYLKQGQWMLFLIAFILIVLGI